MILMLQIFNVIGNENACYKGNELEEIWVQIKEREYQEVSK